MKSLCFLSVLLLTTWNAIAQAPQGFHYQAIVRSNNGELITETNVGVKISIISGSATNLPIYQETHSVTTNDFGLFSLVVGLGTNTSGDFASVKWDAESKFLLLAIDPQGGSNYEDIGTIQLLSVPFAMYAQTSGGNLEDDSINEIQDLVLTDHVLAISKNTSSSQIDLSVYQTDTTLSESEVETFIVNDSINLHVNTTINGKQLNDWNEIDNIPASFVDGDQDNQDLTMEGNTLMLSNDSTSVSLEALFSPWTISDTIIYNLDKAIGIGTQTPATSFHIYGNRNVLFGDSIGGAGDKLMWLPELHAFRVGTVATGAASSYWDKDSVGLYSFATGYNTRAQGFGATAMGRDTEATSSYAFASGFFSNADGQYSTAMGFNTDAFALGSTALGYSTDAEANYSFAAGYFAEAQAIYSVAIGNSVRAQSYASIAVGRYNVGGGSATSWLTNDPIFEIGIGTGPSTRANAVTVRKNGNVGIGTTSPRDRLHVNGRIRLQSVEYIEDGGTSEIAFRGDLRPTTNNIYDIGTAEFRWDDIYATNGTIQTSDARLKKDIHETGYGLQHILRLRPVSFQWKKSSDPSQHIGLLAQDLLEVIPEVVKTHDFQMEEDGTITEIKLETLGVNYSNLIPVLIKAIQEQQEEINSLNERIANLEQE